MPLSKSVKRSTVVEKRAPARRPARVARSTAHDQSVITVLKQFRIVFRSVKQHFRWVEAQCGVSGAQLWTIGKIAESPGIRVSELAKALAVHQSTASNMLDRIEELGLVRRERIASDQRVVRLHLTGKGKAILAKAPEPFQGVLPDALASVPVATLTGLHEHLKTLIDAMKIKDRLGQKTPLSNM